MSALPRPERGRRPAALAAPDNLTTSAPIPFPSRRAAVGVAERFRPGEYERVEQALEDLEALGVQHLRISIPWGEGEEWYRWLLPRLAREVEVLPCIDAPPAGAPEDYAEFVEAVLNRAGRHFEYVELSAETADADQWEAQGETLARAARGAREGGWKVVLGGLARGDSDWLRRLVDHDLMEHVDVVGLHRGGEKAVTEVERLLDERGCRAQVWVTETGASTWRSSELRQCQALVEALGAPVPRIYWYSLHDLAPAAASDEGERHFGMKRCDGTPKLLFRLWSSGGLRRVREAARQPASLTTAKHLIPFRKATRGPHRLPWPPTPAGTRPGS